MKIKKILLLYDAFLSGEFVSRRNFCAEQAISERTFYRYLREIADFFREYKPDCIVEPAGPEGGYILKNAI